MIFLIFIYTSTYTLLGEFMKYIKLSIFVILLIVLFTFINATLSYFNIIKSSTEMILNTIIILVSSLFGGIIIGIKDRRNTSSFILSFTIIIIFLLFKIIFNNKFTTYKLIIYLSIFIFTFIGSIIGKKIKIRN